MQHQWAAQLATSRHQKRNEQFSPLSVRGEQLTGQIEYYKTMLQKQIESNSSAEATATFERLVLLRTRQMRQRIEQIQEELGTVPEGYRRQEIDDLYRDCAMLCAGAEYLSQGTV